MLVWKWEELELQEKNRQNTMISNFSNTCNNLIRAWFEIYLDLENLFFVINTISEITREKFLNGEKHFQNTLSDFRNILTYVN